MVGSNVNAAAAAGQPPAPATAALPEALAWPAFYNFEVLVGGESLVLGTTRLSTEVVARLECSFLFFDLCNDNATLFTI